MKFYNFFRTPKIKKQEEDELVKKENKTFKPPYFEISYLPHFIFVLNNLKKVMDMPFEALQNLFEVKRQ